MKKLYFSCLLLLAFDLATAQPDFLTITPNIVQSTNVCNIGETTTLTANFPILYTTTDYTVTQNTNYNPFPYSGGTLIPTPPITQNQDDFWSPIISLPFNFWFYQVSYQQIQIGSNGLLTFNTTDQLGDICNWIRNNETLPSTNLYPNSIYGVYQDLDFRMRQGDSSINYYVLDTGTYAAPNRVFVLNFTGIPNWPSQNSPGLQTSQIVLHETSNIIEVNVERREPVIQAWNGAGLIGIQNADTTKFLTPAGRNTGAWSAENEGWIFEPNGVALPTTTTWTSNGNTIGTGTSVNVTANQTTTNYTATIGYTYTDGSINTFEVYYDVIVGALNVSDPIDLIYCDNQQNVDLTVNNAVVAGEDIANYEISYYTDLLSAENGTPNRIAFPQNFAIQTTEQTIYIRVTDILGAGCKAVKSFQVKLEAVPFGNEIQYFTSGQTLNDLEVSGTNIVWYDAETEGNLLSGTTLLQDGFTYFAQNGNANSCQSKQTLAGRLAVTVHSTLANTTFNNDKLTLYPNPVNSMLVISSSDNLSNVEIYNTFGQLVKSQNTTAKELKVDVSGLTDGVYFARIYSGNDTTTVKIIKK